MGAEYAEIFLLWTGLEGCAFMPLGTSQSRFQPASQSMLTSWPGHSSNDGCILLCLVETWVNLKVKKLPRYTCWCLWPQGPRKCEKQWFCFRRGMSSCYLCQEVCSFLPDRKATGRNRESLTHWGWQGKGKHKMTKREMEQRGREVGNV